MSNPFDTRDSISLTTKVFRYLRDGIIEGRYQSGDYLVETKLAEELGVSRTPIREALKQLELEDLAESIPNRGVRVKGISQEDIDDIYTIRHHLEGLAAYWAAQRIRPSAAPRQSISGYLWPMMNTKSEFSINCLSALAKSRVFTRDCLGEEICRLPP